MATSVVLVVWNQLDLTRAWLESRRACTTPFDLCVADNGSTDGTAECFEAARWRHRLPSDVRSRWRRVYERCIPRTGARRRS